MLFHYKVHEREVPEDQAGDVTATALDSIGFKRITWRLILSVLFYDNLGLLYSMLVSNFS
jgi:hypothetical protein